MATVLTVLQPWSWALIFGPKRVENRTWPTNYRGRLYIHSGKSEKLIAGAAALDWPATFGIPFPQSDVLHFGAIIGYADLADCVPVAQATPSPWASGPWCWMLENPVALAQPVPCNGNQGLWKFSGEPSADA